MLTESAGLDLLTEALQKLEEGFATLPTFEPKWDWGRMRPILLEVAERMQDNYPYFHPLYVGQMLQPPHPLARLAYALAQFINPNNHALDGGRASSRLEKEAVSQLAAMFGWEAHLGHLTSGGTFANLEGLWIAHQLAPGKRTLASAQAHYTHQRICGVLQVPFTAIPTDSTAHMDLAALELELQKGDVGTVVATMGTSGLGMVDPLPEILALRERYSFRVHADAAYGGYYRLAGALDPRVREAFRRLPEVDSIVVDPHKHGLQPYGCGCILFRDPSVGRFYSHDSPYTYFSSNELHLGEISLECSRAGASAVALWATQRLLPLEPGGELGGRLDESLAAARALHKLLDADARWKCLYAPDLDIVVWAPWAGSPLEGGGGGCYSGSPLEGGGGGCYSGSAAEVSSLSKAVFDAAAELHLHLALTTVPRELVEPHWPELRWDQPQLTCLRSCLMRPDHGRWMSEIWERLQRALDRAAQK